MKTPKAKIMGINTVLPHEQIHEDALLELLNQIKKAKEMIKDHINKHEDLKNKSVRFYSEQVVCQLG